MFRLRIPLILAAAAAVPTSAAVGLVAHRQSECKRELDSLFVTMHGEMTALPLTDTKHRSAALLWYESENERLNAYLRKPFLYQLKNRAPRHCPNVLLDVYESLDD